MPIIAKLDENSVSIPQRFRDARRGDGVHRRTLTDTATAATVPANGPATSSPMLTVRLVATGNVTLSGAQTIDGIAIADGDVVLPVAQITTADRTFWIASTGGAWTRVTNMAYYCGMLVNVREGSANNASLWELVTTGLIVPGTTALSWRLAYATVRDGEITNAKVSSSAAIAYSKLNLANSIVAGDLTSSSVTTPKISDGNVTLPKIDHTGATTNQMLTYNGTSLVWADPASGYTDEQAQDAVGGILTDSSRIYFTYNDGTPSITADVVANSIGAGHLVSGVADVTVRAVVTTDFSGGGGVPNGIPSSSDTDGVSVSADEKVLVYQESDQTLNGPYIVKSTNWVRSSDTIIPGMQIQVASGGTTSGGSVMYCRNTSLPIIGVTNILFGTAKARPLDGSVVEASFAGASVVTTHYFASGSSPSITTIGSAAGTGATASITGKDAGGCITINTGTSCAVNDVLITITFAGSYGAAPKAIVLFPASVNAKPDRVYVDQPSTTATSFTLKVNTVGALDDGATLKWYYIVMG